MTSCAMNIARLGSFDAQVRFTVDNKFRRVRELRESSSTAPSVGVRRRSPRSPGVRGAAEVMEDLGFWEKDPPAVAKASVMGPWDRSM